MEDAVVELVDLSEHSVHFSSAVQAFGNRYQPGEQVIISHHLILINLSFKYWINAMKHSHRKHDCDTTTPVII